MENYQRFQILSSAKQNLFQPESPVWVSRCQLSRDLESGRRLLQTRMVNCSERTVRQVFLRIVCLGANRERLTQLELVPMQSLSVLPGRVFGDDKLVEVPVKGAIYAEVYAQRVCFADGTAWDETDPDSYLAFKAVPVRPEDPHAETLADRARSGGVRNNCYFRAQQGLWVCTCGMPNAARSLRCARCGADRLWLEKHMDPNLIDAPATVRVPEPAPVSVPASAAVPAPAPIPAPMPAVIPVPIRNEPAVQPTIIVQSAPEPEPEAREAPASHAGRNAAILLVVLALLALGAFCAWQYLIPYLRYQEAIRERAAGNYDQAVALFEDIKTFRDSPDQITKTLVRKAESLMGEKKYQEALDILENLEGSEERIAKCLYALGVLAYNDNDLDTALSYLKQLEERFPDYELLNTLAQPCYYSMGSRTVESAAASGGPYAQRRTLYEEAKAYYTRADGYLDSEDRVNACDYWIALTYRDEGDLDAAIAAFEALGDYLDAPVQRQACMLEYVRQHFDSYFYDAAAPAYLEELVAADYSGAKELLDRLHGEGFGFRVSLNKDDDKAEVARDLSKVSIIYSIQQQDGEGAVMVLVYYQLPNGQEGRALLNTDHEASGVKGWRDFPFPDRCAKSGVVTLKFYDAVRGETDEALLDTILFNYSYREPSENDASGTEDGQTPTGGKDPGKIGSSSGGLGTGGKGNLP